MWKHPAMSTPQTLGRRSLFIPLVYGAIHFDLAYSHNTKIMFIQINDTSIFVAMQPTHGIIYLLLCEIIAHHSELSHM